jgi:hypothetical protein
MVFGILARSVAEVTSPQYLVDGRSDYFNIESIETTELLSVAWLANNWHTDVVHTAL